MHIFFILILIQRTGPSIDEPASQVQELKSFFCFVMHQLNSKLCIFFNLYNKFLIKYILYIELHNIFKKNDIGIHNGPIKTDSWVGVKSYKRGWALGSIIQFRDLAQIIKGCEGTISFIFRF